MKKVVLLVLVTIAFYGQAKACNYEAVKAAQDLVDQANESFTKGLSTITDTYEAKSHLLEMQRCQDPSSKLVCKDLVISLSKTFEAEKSGLTFGVRTMSDVLSYHNKLVQAKISCK